MASSSKQRVSRIYLYVNTLPGSVWEEGMQGMSWDIPIKLKRGTPDILRESMYTLEPIIVKTW